jgi:hypothetical protein
MTFADFYFGAVDYYFFMGTSYYGVGDCIDDQAGGARHGTH